MTPRGLPPPARPAIMREVDGLIDTLLPAVAFAAILYGLWFFVLQPRYEFVVRIEDGVPRVARGKVAAGFLDVLADACGDAGVARGSVAGVRRGRRVVLTFSHHIPPGVQQRVRNLWTIGP